MKDKIAGAIASPHELEALYRANPAEFTAALRAVLSEHPDSAVLQAWRERLFFAEASGPDAGRPAAGWLRGRDTALTVLLSLAAGTLAKIPHFFEAVKEERFYPRNAGAIVLGALAAYFCMQKPNRRKIAAVLAALFFGAVLYLNLIPDPARSQTIPLACMHMPFFFWSLLGVAFLGGMWRNPGERMNFIRYSGELLIYTTIILIGGMILTGLTIWLFKLLKLDIAEWYLHNAAVYGAAAAPVVATLLIDRLAAGRFRIAPVLARVFTPLFLLTALAYLLAMIVTGRSPFTNRDFLIAFNGLLLLVLALCVFSVSERGRHESAGAGDLLNISLALTTLVIDIIALSAIVFRLGAYGLTPNRLAVLGGNVLAFCHLAGLLWHYIRFAARKAGFEPLERWITGYIPAYTVWSVVVAAAFPPAFGFK